MEEGPMSPAFYRLVIVALVVYVAFQASLLSGYEAITDQQNQTIDRLFQACGLEVTHD